MIREKLALVLLTKDHPYLIENWINIIKETNRIANVNVYIYDSSIDDTTKKLCHNANVPFIHYRPCDPDMEGNVKAYYCLNDVDYEYLWLCADGGVPNLDMVNSILEKMVSAGFDVLHFFGKSEMNIHYRKKHNIPNILRFSKNDLIQFCDEFYWSLAAWGITILNKRLINTLDFEEFLRLNEVKNFLYPSMIFYALAQLDDVKCIVLCHNCFTANRRKQTHGWEEAGEFVEIFSYKLYISVKNLPAFYDPCKKSVVENFCLNNQFFTTKGLLQFRTKGCYSYHDFKRYKKYLVVTTGKKRWQLLILSVLPMFLCRYLVKRFD